MKNRIALKAMLVLLALTMIAGMLPGLMLTAWAAPSVSYIECRWDGNKVVKTEKTIQNYTSLKNERQWWKYDKWYVVDKDITTNSIIVVEGKANLILCDGVTWESKFPLFVDEKATLNIYAQGKGTGRLIANSGHYQGTAGIGGQGLNLASVCTATCGSINIHGGSIKAIGGSRSAGIGGSEFGDCGNITIYDGIINATGGAEGGAGIGCGVLNYYGKITIYGGQITATGGSYGAGIGGGWIQGKNEVRSDNGSINIYDGLITATGGEYAAGIGGGCGNAQLRGRGGAVNIYGGTVRAYAGSLSAGIGGGWYTHGANVTINGGRVVAKGNGGAGIGGGYNGDGGTFTLNGGIVTAEGGNQAAGVGSGENANGGTVNINGGRVKATGGDHGAGIGGGNKGKGGTVNINGGEVTATGGSQGAGIGGSSGDNGNITVNAGEVTATGGNGGAGIGGGYKCNGGKIAINGGTVTAIGGDSAANETTVGIGGGIQNQGNGTLSLDTWVTLFHDTTDYENMIVVGKTNYKGDLYRTMKTVARQYKEGSIHYGDEGVDKIDTDAPFTPGLDITDAGDLKYVTYTSTNTNVAKVDENGEVTIVGPGTATIKANIPEYTENYHYNSTSTWYEVRVRVPVPYIEHGWNGSSLTTTTKNCNVYTEITSLYDNYYEAKWNEGWYVARKGKTTISDRVSLTGNVNIILCDGAELALNGGIKTNAFTLTIYAQNDNTNYAGSLTATGNSGNAAIGGMSGYVAGHLRIHGGNVVANAENGGGAGIGSRLVVYGGDVNAYGGSGSAGIGAGANRDGSDVTVYGGVVYGAGNSGGAGIGGGYGGAGGNVVIYGGDVKAMGGIVSNKITDYKNCGMGIGHGYNNSKNGALTVASGLYVKGDDMPQNPTTYVPWRNGGYVRQLSMRVNGNRPPHTHKFAFTAEGPTITGVCTAAGCVDEYDIHPISLTITAEDGAYDGKTAYGGSLIGLDVFRAETPYSITNAWIDYYKGDTLLKGAPVDAGAYTAKITLGGATASVDYVVTPAKITEVKLKETILKLQSGETVSAVVSEVKAGDLTAPAEAYTVSGDGPISKEGNYKLTVTAKEEGNFIGTAAADFHVVQPGKYFEAHLTETDFFYTGREIRPEVTVTDVDTGKPLAEGDYTLSYSNNINPTQGGQVLVTGNNGYTSPNGDGFTQKVTRTFTIHPEFLDVSANNKTIIYGEAPDNDGVLYSGFVNGETASVLKGKLDFDYDYAQFGDVGRYTITPKGLNADHYVIDFVPGYLTVIPKAVRLNWDDDTFVYDGNAHIPTVAVTGMVNGDAITATVTGEGMDAGSYTAKVTGLAGEKKGNYMLPRVVEHTFTIAKRPTGNREVNLYRIYTVKSVRQSIAGLVPNNPAPGTVTYDVGTVSNNTGMRVTDFAVDAKGMVTATLSGGTEKDIGKTIILPVKVTTTNYDEFVVNIVLNIDDKRVPFVTVPELNELVYNGEEQALITAGSATAGEMQYALGKDDSTVPEEAQWGTKIPTGKDAGSYYIWYRVKVEGNDTVKSLEPKARTNTIQPKDATITAKPQNVGVYGAIDSSTSQVTAAGLLSGHTVSAVTMISSGTENITTEGTITPIGAVIRDEKGNDVTANYRIEYEAGLLTVGKVQPLMTPPRAGYLQPYNGKAQTLVTRGSAKGGQIEYALGAKDAAPSTNAFGTAIPTGTDAGTYYVWYRVVGDEKHTDIAPAYVTVTISQARLTEVRLERTILNYSGKELVVNISEVKAGVLNVPQTAYTFSGNRATSAGSHTVSVTAKESGNYTGTVTADFHILKTTSNLFEVVLPYTAFEYTGEAIIPKEVRVIDAITRRDLEAKDYEVTYAKNTNVTDAAEVHVKGLNGYLTIGDNGSDYTDTVTRYFTIYKIPAEVNTPPKALEGLVYNGNSLKLIEGGTGKGGEMRYSLDGTNYSANIPTQINAGTYTVYYKVFGDANHSDTEAEMVTVSIAKADAAADAPKGLSLTYTGKAQALVSAGTPTGGTMRYSLDGMTYTDDIPVATNAGTYAIHYKVVGDTNHNDTEAESVTATIAKGAPTFTAPTGRTLTYTGKAQALVSAGTANGGTIQYSLDGTEYSTAIPVGTETKDYTVYYRVVGDVNHSDVEAEDVTAKIVKAEAAVVAPVARTLTYTGRAQALVIAGKTTGGTMWYALEDKPFTRAIPTATDAGEYTVHYKVMGDANHNDIKEDNTVTVTIAKANPTVIAPTPRELTYTGQAQALVNAGAATGGAMQYSLDDANYSADIPTGTDAGKYTVWYRVVGDGNHANTKAESVSVTISRATLTEVKLERTILAYKDGEELSAKVSEVKAGERVVPAEAYSISGNRATDVGSHTVKVTAKEDSNYTGTVTADFQIVQLKQKLFEVYLPDDTFEYRGEKITPNVKVIDVETDKELDQAHYELAYGSNTNVTDDAWVQVKGKDGYLSLSGDKTVDTVIKTFTITKVPSKVDKVPTGKRLSYTDDKEEPLVEAGSATGGTMVYSLDNEVWTAEVPTGRLAKTYTVYYKVVGDINHNDTEVRAVTATIDSVEATATEEPKPKDLTYNGRAQALVSAGKPSGGVMQYSLDDITYTEAIPTATDAGSYTVYYKVVGDANHSDASAKSVKVSIAKAPINPTISIDGWTYGEKANAPIVKGNDGNGEVTYFYAAKGGTSYSAIMPADAGEYTVKATVEESTNYLGATTDTVSFVIAKASITPVVSINGWVFGEDANAPSVEGNPGNGEVTYTYAARGSASYSVNVPVDAGKYTVKATVAETKNYLGGEATADFVIQKAEEPESDVVIWELEDLRDIDIRTGERFMCKGVTLTSLNGLASFGDKGAIFAGYGFGNDSFSFQAERPVVKIEITGVAHELNWTDAKKTANGIEWTGNATAVDFGKHIDQITRIVFTLGHEGSETDEVITEAQLPEADFVTPGALKTVGNEAFAGIGATNVRISDGTETLDSMAFANCPNLRSIYIPGSVGSIASDLLAGCRNVTVYGKSAVAKDFAKKNGFVYVRVQ